MSQIIKAFTGIYILLFLMSTGTGLLGAFLQTLQVQNLHGRVIDEMENSDYATPVLEEVFALAEENGAQLKLCLYMEDGEIRYCDSADLVPESPVKVRMAEVQISYPIELPLVRATRDYCLSGYAR